MAESTGARMINYTERISLLMRDIITRVPHLSYIDPDELLVFARYGRRGAAGAFATCHCVCLPPTEPGYYYWRDRQTGRITRRSRWFVTKSPTVLRWRATGAVPDLLRAAALLRPGAGRLPEGAVLRPAPRAGWRSSTPSCTSCITSTRRRRGSGASSGATAGPQPGRTGGTSSRTWRGWCSAYLATDPDPAAYDFLRYDFAGLEARFGGVAGTTFRTFPSFPQRYIDVLPASMQPDTPSSVRIQALKTPAGPMHFTDHDLVTRQFLERATRRLARREAPPARRALHADPIPLRCRRGRITACAAATD